MHKFFDENKQGRDIVVGDIHGCFHLLQEALDKIGFDPKRDRLFSVGDLVDRGPQSALANEWIDRPWFHAVRGNHEQMLIDYTEGKLERYMYYVNGGKWFIDLPQDVQKNYAAKLSQLPIAMTVDTAKGRVGMVHAECPGDDWDHFIHDTSDPKLTMVAIWSRSKIHNEDESVVSGVDKIFVGHTPVKESFSLGNTQFIDTGACYDDGRLSLYNLDGKELITIPFKTLEKNNEPR